MINGNDLIIMIIVIVIISIIVIIIIIIFVIIVRCTTGRRYFAHVSCERRRVYHHLY